MLWIIVIAVVSMSVLSLLAGIGLGIAAKRFHVEEDPLVDKLNSVLPAINCGNCGFAGCHPYAEAMSAGTAEINLCVPGGVRTMEELAVLLGVEPKPVGADLGPRVAFINEALCIGCTACVKACPVDAIVGANKQSHTVIANECTNCDACIKPCPVSCIEMVPVAATVYDWKWQKPAGPAPALPAAA
ncbi:MAG: electron transport complex subunit RsxB [Magnetococcales bacterium]|nr:electron transport complex subunit RsxB [Magnetococcales bacterium]